MDLPPIEDDDAVWRALAHPHRRRILDVLRTAPRTTGEVVDALGEDRHVVMQHLRVLREADLVIAEVAGRRRINHLNPVPIGRIHDRWVSRYEENWVAALVGLRAAVEQGEPEKGRRVG
jgi:DNA-binding transcriptional ArsR family regulator